MTNPHAGDNASSYIRVMEKLAAGAEDWVTKESKRLNGILAKRTMAQSKLDEIKRKANVLAAFVEEKKEEAKEEL
ncbi:hypothetical protein FRC10_000975 [Ceratobasidium sp. 414]|nr:hypothetical protein FRC10_000975 [Ceratobasidium sp. 414]